MGKQGGAPPQQSGAPSSSGGQSGGFFGYAPPPKFSGNFMQDVTNVGDWAGSQYAKGMASPFKLANQAFDDATGMPGTPDYMGAAGQQGQLNQQSVQQQTQANRPGQNTPFASTQWTQNPDGTWTQNTGLSGGLGMAAEGLRGQAAGLANAMDWSQFGQLDDGTAARKQAIDASMADARRHLDPMFSERENQMKASLANAGLDPNSAASRNSVSGFNQSRGDAYQQALNNAIMHGVQAQSATFGQNMASRQQAIAEALRKRGQPLDELQALQGFTQMPGFMGAGQAAPSPYLQALMAQSGYDMDKWGARNQAWGDVMQGYGQFLQAGASVIPGAGAMGGGGIPGFLKYSKPSGPRVG